MKLHETNPNGLNIFTGIDADGFGINGFRHRGNIAVLPTEIVQQWTANQLATLAEADFERIAGFDLDIILLGTGQRLVFPDRRLMRPLYEKGRGVEVMDTPAACRTFNILVAEGRKVGAFLLIDPPAAGS